MRIERVLLPNTQAFGRHQDFFIYRGDIESSVAPGNKQHKLKYHLQGARSEGATYIATFGGPHSNHIDAFVGRAVELGFRPIVVVRGEVQPKLTPTLKAAVARGAVLYPSSRVDYKLGLRSNIKQQVDSDFGEVYWIDEGGSGPLGVKGCRDWADEILHEGYGDKATNLWEIICVSSGTGTTAAGFLGSSKVDQLAVFSALKGDKGLGQNIRAQATTDTSSKKLLTFDECHHGGFGKFSPALFHFLSDMHRLNPALTLDPVYTGKMLFRVWQLAATGRWPYQSTLFIHTGGVQGWRGVPRDLWPYNVMGN